MPEPNAGRGGPECPDAAAPAGGWVLAFLLAATGWGVLGAPWLSGAVTIPWDAKAHFYPQLQFLAQSIHRGEWPWWTPFVFSGSPQVADPQSLMTSPPFLLLAALDPDPSFRAFDAVVLGMLGLGGLANLLIFRDRGWHPAGGLVAALVFAFGASAAWRIQHVGQILSLSVWPIALWLVLRALERRSWSWGALSGLAAGFLAINRDQVAFIGLWLLAGAVLAHWLTSPAPLATVRKTAGPLFAGGITGLAIVAVPVAMTLFLAEDSNRPDFSFAEAAKGAIHPALLLTAAVPNLFGADGPFAQYWGPPSPLWGPVDRVLARNMGVLYLGALPFFMLAAGFARGVVFAREVRAVTVAFLLVLLYALGGATPVFRTLFELVPGIDLFRRPADAAFFVGALGAILAGYGIHRLIIDRALPERSPWRAPEALFAAALFLAAIALAAAKGTLAIAAWPLVKAALCSGVSLAALSMLPRLAAVRPPLAMTLVAALLIADLAWNNGPNESTALPPQTFDVLRTDSRNQTLAVVKSRLGPGSLDRVELTGLDFHWPNASLVHRLHNVLGYNPLRLALYTQATGAEDHVALPEQRRFSPLFPSYRSRIADQLGLRLIATGVPIERVDPRLKPGDLVLIAQTADGYVYENPRAGPRVAFKRRAVQADFARLLQEGSWPAAGGDTVLLQVVQETAGKTVEEMRSASGDGEVRVHITDYRNTEILIDVATPSPGWLVLNDPFHPWWTAQVDGREVPMLQADVLFRAVWLAAGTHRVHFVFRPFRGAWREAGRRWGILAHAETLARSLRP